MCNFLKQRLHQFPAEASFLGREGRVVRRRSSAAGGLSSLGVFAACTLSLAASCGLAANKQPQQRHLPRVRLFLTRRKALPGPQQCFSPTSPEATLPTASAGREPQQTLHYSFSFLTLFSLNDLERQQPTIP
jgi:hypothetical protein